MIAFRDTLTMPSRIFQYTKPTYNLYIAQVARLLGLYATNNRHSAYVEHYANPHRNEILIQLVHTPKCGGRFLKQQLNTHATTLPPKYTQVFPRCIKDL